MTENAHILVVEDELKFRRVIQKILASQGFEVWAARRGQEGIELVRSENFDLVLLDINLPDMTGIHVCREIRAASNVVIVMLTVRDSEEDKIAAFSAGADDYVTKPFKTSELLARIRAHLRRQAATGYSPDIFSFEECVIDFPRRTITRHGERVPLSPKQFQLLRYLVANRGKALSHRAMLQSVWGADYGEETNLLHASIAQLPKKIERDPNAPRYIVTIPWFGYRFTVPSENERASPPTQNHS